MCLSNDATHSRPSVCHWGVLFLRQTAAGEPSPPPSRSARSRRPPRQSRRSSVRTAGRHSGHKCAGAASVAELNPARFSIWAVDVSWPAGRQRRALTRECASVFWRAALWMFSAAFGVITIISTIVVSEAAPDAGREAR